MREAIISESKQNKYNSVQAGIDEYLNSPDKIKEFELAEVKKADEFKRRLEANQAKCDAWQQKREYLRLNFDKLVSAPVDILKVESRLRPYALELFKNRIDRSNKELYLFHQAIFNYIELQHENGILNENDLLKFIIELSKNSSNLIYDKKILDEEAWFRVKLFWGKYQKILDCRNFKSKNDVISYLIKKPENIEMINQDRVEIMFTPYSVNLTFLDDRKSYIAFISGKDDKEDRYKSNLGLSYYSKDVSVTTVFASSDSPKEARATFEHEQKHKKDHVFGYKNFGNNYYFEKDTLQGSLDSLKSEIFAFLISEDGAQEIEDAFKGYHSLYKNLSSQEIVTYKKILRESLGVIKEMMSRGIPRDKIAGLFIRTDLDQWVKHYKRFASDKKILHW